MCVLPQSLAGESINSLHQRFLDLLPRIETHGQIFFRNVRCAVRKADCIAEMVALAWKWFRRLAEQGKDAAKFVFTLASLAARAVKSGRRLCGQERAKDVMSHRAHYLHQFGVKRLPASTQRSQEQLYAQPHGQEMMDAYEERFRDNAQTPVPDQVAFRLDWPRFLASLGDRDRRLAEYLSLGHGAGDAARRFHLTPGRVTQLRQRWHQQWQSFQGELESSRRSSSCPDQS